MKNANAPLAWTLAALSLACVSSAPREARRAPAVELRLGVFDSRALAVAYTASDAFAERLAELRGEHERAAARQDAGEAERLAERGAALQARIHQQGFSTLPVDDILASLADALPAIAAEAGVDAIVSEWRLAYAHESLVLVDVTELLIQPLSPSAETLRTIRALRAQEPLPLLETDWAAFERH